MGIRPRLTLLAGLDDFDFDTEEWKVKDPRFGGNHANDLWDMKCELPADIDDWDDPNFAKNLSIRSTLQTAAGAKWGDNVIDVGELIHFSPEYGNSNVIGLRLGEEMAGNSGWVIYALAAMFPQFDFDNSPGYHTFQSKNVDETDDENLWKQSYMRLQSDDYPNTDHDKRLAGMLQELIDANMNNGVNSFTGATWGYAAHYLFTHGLNMNVRQSEIKLILSWQWS